MWWACALALAAASPEAAVREAVAARLHVPLDDVEVAPLQLAAAADWRAELPTVGPVWGSVPVVIFGTSASGPVRYAVRPRITVFQELPVAAGATAAGTAVTVRTARVALDDLRGATPVDPALRWEARVDLAPDTPLTTRCVRPLPDAKEGATVRIVAGSGPLRVMSVGRLGDDAFVGAEVIVESLATRTQLRGVLQADGTVYVGGPP